MSDKTHENSINFESAPVACGSDVDKQRNDTEEDNRQPIAEPSAPVTNENQTQHTAEVVDQANVDKLNTGTEEDIQNKGTEEDIQNKGTEEDIQNKGTEEDIQNKGTEEDIQNKGTEEDTQKKGTEEDTGQAVVVTNDNNFDNPIQDTTDEVEQAASLNNDNHSLNTKPDVGQAASGICDNDDKKLRLDIKPDDGKALSTSEDSTPVTDAKTVDKTNLDTAQNTGQAYKVLETRNKTLEDEMDNLKQRETEIRQSYKVLETRNKTLEDEMDNLKQRETEIRQSNKNLTEDIEKLKEEITSSKKSEEDANNQKTELTERDKLLKEETQSRKKAENNNKALQKEVAKWKNDLSKSEENKSKLQREVKDLKSQNEKWKSENQQCKDDIQKLTTSKSKLQTEVKDLKSQNEKWKSENQQWKDDMQKLTTRKIQLEKEHADHQQIVKMLLEDQNRVQKECDDLNKKITNLKENNEQITNQKYIAEKTARERERIIQQLQAEMRGMDEKINCLENDKKDLTLRLSKLAGANLTYNNPNIADLSDENRPTKLAEVFSELYDNEWTDAFEDIDIKDECDKTQFMLSLLKRASDICHEASKRHATAIKHSFSTLSIEDLEVETVTTVHDVSESATTKILGESKIKDKKESESERNPETETYSPSANANETLTCVTGYASEGEANEEMKKENGQVQATDGGYQLPSVNAIELHQKNEDDTISNEEEYKIKDNKEIESEQKLETKTHSPAACGDNADETQTSGTAYSAEIEANEEIKKENGQINEHDGDNKLTSVNVTELHHEKEDDTVSNKEREANDEMKKENGEIQTHDDDNNLTSVNVQEPHQEMEDDTVSNKEEANEEMRKKNIQIQTTDNVGHLTSVDFIELHQKKEDDTSSNERESKIQKKKEIEKEQNLETETHSPSACGNSADETQTCVTGYTAESCEASAQTEPISEAPGKKVRATYIEISADFEQLSNEQKKTIFEIRKVIENQLSNQFQKVGTEIIVKELSTDQQNQVSVVAYIKKCMTICWSMCRHEPPVHIHFPEIEGDLPYDTNMYKPYTKSGKHLDFVVWPALYLHEGGPMLAKGVAQGRK